MFAFLSSLPSISLQTPITRFGFFSSLFCARTVYPLFLINTYFYTSRPRQVELYRSQSTMRFAVALAAVFAGLAAAQTTTSPSTAAPSSDICAQDIVDSCVAQFKTRIDKCNEKPNDWVCLCDENTNLLTCYNNCPKSPDRSPVENSATQFCNAAAPLKASMSSVAATAVKTSASSSSTSGASATSSSPIASSSLQPERNAAEALGIPVGGVFAFVLGMANVL
ncbi:unnamed protein product [Periconia digitata]|uniref:GPI anchored serine-threonine rich protein n=1 Tax=Periconia digitata TaxID=1303443 RepID=A0A9W4XXY7_9PLEO|nr:unnamed protein product [Periconia digitata]